MRVLKLIVGLFKQAFRKTFSILHMSRMCKIRHKDHSCVRAPSAGLVILVHHSNIKNKQSILRTVHHLYVPTMHNEYMGVCLILVHGSVV